MNSKKRARREDDRGTTEIEALTSSSVTALMAKNSTKRAQQRDGKRQTIKREEDISEVEDIQARNKGKGKE